MVRWDATARSNNNTERTALSKDIIYKDDKLLKKFLNETLNAELSVIATWNDLGEGTGINRCIDYYWNGEWQIPAHFMELTRKSQEGETLK